MYAFLDRALKLVVKTGTLRVTDRQENLTSMATAAERQ